MIRKLLNGDIDRVADIWLKTNLKAHYFISNQYWKSNYELVKELNHRHFIGLRLTDVELDLLDQGAACLSISRSEYLRKLLLEKQINHQIEVVADMNDLRKLVSEYGKIGSNLNQIAKHFNSGGSQSRAIENEIHQCITDLFLLRKEVLKLAGGVNGNRKTH